jgi:hypothetical protein
VKAPVTFCAFAINRYAHNIIPVLLLRC